MPTIMKNGRPVSIAVARIYLPTYLDSPTTYFYNKRENPEAKGPESAIPFYKSMGIGIEEEHSDDYMSTCILPDGWGFVEDGGGYWTTVFDDKKRERFTYFEKMAFWDRDAFTRRCRRYNYTWDYDAYHREPGFVIFRYVVKDADGTELYECEPIILKDESDNEDVEVRKSFYESSEAARKKLGAECEEYLNKNYPDWQDYNAYWD